MGVDATLMRLEQRGTGSNRRRLTPTATASDHGDVLVRLVDRVRGRSRYPMLERVDPYGSLMPTSAEMPRFLEEPARPRSLDPAPEDLQVIGRLEELARECAANPMTELHLDGDWLPSRTRVPDSGRRPRRCGGPGSGGRWAVRNVSSDTVTPGRGTSSRAGHPVGLIDWEVAGPVDPLVELAQMCRLNAQLHDDDVAERAGLPSLETRAGQPRLIVDGYGLSAAQRSGFLDTIIEVAVRDAADQAIEARVTPDSRDCGPLWGMAWRVRGRRG